MNLNLKGRSVLVGVTGSIAIYKTCELIRLFVKAEAKVRVVMTKSAIKFISPLTFEALTRERALTDNSEDWSSDLNHIDYAKWADIFIIAPATANSINKLSKGIADNILLQTALAFNKPLLIAPSANVNMVENHYTKGSLKMLSVNDITIINSQTKLLACGDMGNGALAEPLEIFYQGAKALLIDEYWNNRRVVVTGGGTIEKIDEVRYISNFSSGKMANALATALYLKGADVCLITTRPHQDIPKDIYVIDVESSEEMYEYLEDAIRVAKRGKMTKASLNSTNPIQIVKKRPFLFMASAVADFIPKYPQQGKIKKSSLGDEWRLELIKNRDILKSIDKDGVVTIGFKAEMDRDIGLNSAKEMLHSKNIDGVCYNLLNNSGSFGTNTNSITFITTDRVVNLGEDEKLSISFKILEESKKLSDG